MVNRFFMWKAHDAAVKSIASTPGDPNLFTGGMEGIKVRRTREKGSTNTTSTIKRSVMRRERNKHANHALTIHACNKQLHHHFFIQK